MKRVCVTLGALALLPGTALAQPYDEPHFGGVKVGVSVDRRTLEAISELPPLGAKMDEDKAGIGFRGHVGYDLQIGGAFVFGVEGGLGRGGHSVTTDAGIADYTLKPGWSWDVSGRAGVMATPNLLVYGRAGHSWVRARETTDFRDVKRSDIEKNGTKHGFLWGAGVEAAVSSGLSARAEYNRTNYGEGVRSSKILLGLSLGF